MEPLVAASALFGVFIALVLLRVPVAFALALACVPVILLTDSVSFFAIIDRTYNSFNSFLLLSVPFFLLSANLMNATGVTKRLVALATATVGHFPGGLGHINVFVSMLFAGVSGSSTAEAAGIGKVLVPAMLKQGYDRSFSIAITACASVMGVIIPPSILMLIWGGTMSISVGALFLAGIIPGVALGLSMMATVYFYAKKYNYPRFEKPSLSHFIKAFLGAAPGLVTPVIILVGISFGFFTPTEASAIAVVYSVMLGIAYGSLNTRTFFLYLSDSAKLVGITLFCVGTASVFSWLLAYYRVPQALVTLIQGFGLGPHGVILIIAAVFLFVGLFIDAIPAIIVVGSIMYPLAQAAGIHPIHFSIVGVVALAFGLVTPPYGMCLLIVARIGEMQVHNVLKDVFTILLPMLGILLLLCLVPEISLFLPRLISPQFM